MTKDQETTLKNLEILHAHVLKNLEKEEYVSMSEFFGMTAPHKAYTLSAGAKITSHVCGTTKCLLGESTVVIPPEPSDFDTRGYEFSIDRYSDRVYPALGRRNPMPEMLGRSLMWPTPQWSAVFDGDIPDEEAVDNLEEHINRWREEWIA